eukprot:1593404-Ditylum_brightwellii.AAC.1
MRPITKGITSGVASKVLVPNPEALKSPAMFDKAFNTPFEGTDIQQYIGENGTGKGAKEILVGNFDSDRFDNLPA